MSLQIENQELLQSTNFQRCQFHKKTLDFICIDNNCKKRGLICKHCAFNEHPQHTIVPFDMFIISLQQQFDKPHVKSQFMNYFQLFDQVSGEIQYQFEDLSVKVRAYTEAVKQERQLFNAQNRHAITRETEGVTQLLKKLLFSKQDSQQELVNKLFEHVEASQIFEGENKEPKLQIQIKKFDKSKQLAEKSLEEMLKIKQNLIQVIDQVKDLLGLKAFEKDLMLDSQDDIFTQNQNTHLQQIYQTQQQQQQGQLMQLKQSINQLATSANSDKDLKLSQNSRDQSFNQMVNQQQYQNVTPIKNSIAVNQQNQSNSNSKQNNDISEIFIQKLPTFSPSSAQDHFQKPELQNKNNTVNNLIFEDQYQTPDKCYYNQLDNNGMDNSEVTHRSQISHSNTWAEKSLNKSTNRRNNISMIYQSAIIDNISLTGKVSKSQVKDSVDILTQVDLEKISENENQSQIQKMRFKLNEEINKKSTDEIDELIRKLDTIEVTQEAKYNLSKMKVNDYFLQGFSQMIRKKKSLIKLQINTDDGVFEPEAIDQLVDAVQELSELEGLCFTFVGTSVNCATHQSICELVAKLKKLHTLILLYDNDINVESAKESVLRVAPHIKELNISTAKKQ